LAGIFVLALRDPLAHRLGSGAEGAAQSEHSLGGGTLHAVMARREAHALGGLAVAVGPQDDRGGRNKTHPENIADASISRPSTTRGPERLKYADASSRCTCAARPRSRSA